MASIVGSSRGRPHVAFPISLAVYADKTRRMTENKKVTLYRLEQAQEVVLYRMEPQAIPKKLENYLRA